MTDPIRISLRDLNDPRVDEALAQEAAIRRTWVDDGHGGEAVGRLERRRGGQGGGRGEGIYLTGVGVTAVLGLIGALLAWAAFEPFIEDGSTEDGAVSFFMIPCVLGAVGTLVGASDGLMSRAWGRAALNAGIGLAVATVGGLVCLFVAGILFVIGQNVLLGVLQATVPRVLRDLDDAGGLPFVVTVGLMIVRAMAWSVFPLAAGIGPGLAQKSRDLAMVGLVGGVLGGFVGGIVFDPLGNLVGGGEASRAVGFGFVGFVTGLSIGLVEQLSKDAWLYMEEGPLAGKQFVIYRDPTKIGSSPKCDVFIFKDPDVQPEHCTLRRSGATHEVEAVGSVPVVVNGQRVARQRLEDGDEVRIGRARFRYYVRRKKKEIR